MKIEGDYSLKASPAVLWEKLLDTDTLAKITPGVKHLEMTEPDQYIATSEIKIGPVQGAFKGNMAIKDKKELEGFTMVLSQKSKIGNATAEIQLNILPQTGAETTIKYEGKAKLTGVLASTGQRVIGGVVKTIAKQFFKALEKELASAETTPPTSPTMDQKPLTSTDAPDQGSQLPTGPPSDQAPSS